MKKIYFTPGPSELLPEIKSYINDAVESNICSINHRSSEFMDIFKSTVNNIKKLFNIPAEYHIFFLASATECMDRLIQNCVKERTFHFVNGAFAERFYKTAIELEKRPEKAETEYGEGFNFEEINIYNEPELICFTQNETSTGAAISPEDIYKIKEQHSDAIITVDIVSSAPYVNLDFNKVDSAFFSVQKGFGMPAGLGLLIVNEKCLEKARELKSENYNIGSYHNFLSLYENAVKYQTSETPNVLDIYLLNRVCGQFLDYGIDNIRKETEVKSEILYSYLESADRLKPFVNNSKDRSKTVIVADAGTEQPILKKKLAEQGLIAGSGYGRYKDTQIRIANFPAHKISDINLIVETLNK